MNAKGAIRLNGTKFSADDRTLKQIGRIATAHFKRQNVKISLEAMKAPRTSSHYYDNPNYVFDSKLNEIILLPGV